MSDPTIRHFPDLEFTVKATLEPAFQHSVDYVIYEILGTQSDGQLLYNKASADSMEPVETLEEAQIFAHGSVKWDGCSNWHFDITDECMLHACTQESLLNVGKILEQCWLLTRELCPNWQDL